MNVNFTDKPFARLEKVDEGTRTFSGVVTAAVVDRDNERPTYGPMKRAIKEWSNESARATGGKSLGNVRLMHGPTIAGKVTAIDYDDANQTIRVTVSPASDEIWHLVRDGFIQGFSVGGNYKKRTCSECQGDMLHAQ